MSFKQLVRTLYWEAGALMSNEEGWGILWYSVDVRCRLFGGSDGIILCLIFWMSVMSVLQGGSFFLIVTYGVHGLEVFGR